MDIMNSELSAEERTALEQELEEIRKKLGWKTWRKPN